jgi:hypothetical protein
MPQVIRQGDAEMHWERCSGWDAVDPRWRVHVIETSYASVEQVADELTGWIEAERELLSSGRHPLTAL